MLCSKTPEFSKDGPEAYQDQNQDPVVLGGRTPLNHPSYILLTLTVLEARRARREHRGSLRMQGASL